MEFQKTATVLLLLALSAENFAYYPAPPFDSGEGCEFQIISANRVADDSFIYVDYWDATQRRSTVLVAKQGGVATLYPRMNFTNVLLEFDDPATPATDGRYEGAMECGKGAAVRLKPLADVAGAVAFQNGSMADGASIELVCSDGIERKAIASENGAFYFKGVGVGECLLISRQGEESAKQPLLLSQGEFKQVALQLSKPDLAPLIAAFFVLALLLCALLFGLRGKKPKWQEAERQRKGRPPPPPSVPTQRQLDLLATLDEKEKGIVQYVQKSAPAAVKVPKLRRELLIPKTSLTRTLLALERKQFIKLEKVGSRSFAKLHPFFSNAEGKGHMVQRTLG